MSAKPTQKQVGKLLPLQSIAERLTKDELAGLSAFLSKPEAGAAAKVWVLKGLCDSEMVKRGMTQPNPRTSGEDKVKRLNAILNHSTKCAIADAVTDEKNAMGKYDDESFVGALRACHGLNEFFGDQAQSAIENRDVSFFESTIEAVEALKGNRKAPFKDSPKMVMHVRAGHAVALKLIQGKKPDPTIKEFEKLVTTELKALNMAPFSEARSWREVRKRCGFDHLKQAYVGRTQT